MSADAEQPRLSARWVLVIALAAMLVLFVLAMLTAWRAGAEHGTYPDWLAAFATLAAFGAAGVAGWYAHRALLVEQERDRVRDTQTERAQAELVAAWIDQGPMYSAANAGGAVGSVQVTGVWALIRNASQLPVTEVELEIYHYPVQRDEPEFIASRGIRLLPPDHREDVAFQAAEIAPMAPAPDVDRGARVMLVFTDAGGRTWVRRLDGTLQIASND